MRLNSCSSAASFFMFSRSCTSAASWSAAICRHVALSSAISARRSMLASARRALTWRTCSSRMRSTSSRFSRSRRLSSRYLQRGRGAGTEGSLGPRCRATCAKAALQGFVALASLCVSRASGFVCKEWLDPVFKIPDSS